MDQMVEAIYKVNLGVKDDDRVLVFTDIPELEDNGKEGDLESWKSLNEIAHQVSSLGETLGHTHFHQFPSLGGNGKEVPVDIWKAAFGPRAVSEMEVDGVLDRILHKRASDSDIKKVEEIAIDHKDLAVDCVIALSKYSTSHTRFRDILTRCTGARYASMPHFDEDMVHGIMLADWRGVEKLTTELCTKLKGADSVRVTTPIGTDITMSLEGRTLEPDTGILTSEGDFGNLPAGEAYVAPLEGTASGRLVLEWGPTRKLDSPITLTVGEGMVRVVEGDDGYAEELRERIEEMPMAANIAELGIGTNERATRADNILEAEKILGTIHIAIGDNSTFGGTVSVPFHQDFIFFAPTLKFTKGGEEVTILDCGKMTL